MLQPGESMQASEMFLLDDHHNSSVTHKEILENERLFHHCALRTGDLSCGPPWKSVTSYILPVFLISHGISLVFRASCIFNLKER